MAGSLTGSSTTSTGSYPSAGPSSENILSEILFGISFLVFNAN